MTKQKILDLLPHRPPFLFLDTIQHLDKQRIQATWHVTPEAYFFQGHYPSHPIMPGVLLCEAVLQAGAVLIANTLQNNATSNNKIPVVTRMQDAKFKQQVQPNDTLEIEAELKERIQDAFYLVGRIRVKNKLALRLEFTVAAVDAAGQGKDNK